jgi:N-acetylglucosaminyldiphosphoundecaprenol N-acetyl-beta-D-mannosaminyltransferase
MAKNKRRYEMQGSKSFRKTVNIFGTKLISIQKEKVLKQVEKNISDNRKFLLLTPNSEILLKSRKNKILQDVINSAEIKVADSVGLKFAYKYLKKKSTINNKALRYLVEFVELIKQLILLPFSDNESEPFPVIKGRELFIDIIKMCSKKGWKIYLLGGEDSVSEKTKKTLKKKFKILRVRAGEGPMLDNEGVPKGKKDIEIEKEIISDINNFSPDIIFVAFGAPKQELWSDRNLSKLNTKAIMVVGGTFDYISGKAKLPPKWMEDLGLEWFWRLVIQPKRFARILSATVIFPFYVFLQKVNNFES